MIETTSLGACRRSLVVDRLPQFGVQRNMITPGDIEGAVQIAASIVNIIQDAFAFSSECKELQARCTAVQSLITDSSSHGDLHGLSELRERLDKCQAYLKSCEQKRYGRRNPIFEVTFHRRIHKYNSRIDRWIILSTLSFVVFLSNKTH